MVELEIIRAETMGFCMGVRRAMGIVMDVAENNPGKRVFTLGPLIHNPSVLDRLTARGIEIMNDPAEAESGDIVIIRAHGVPPSVKDVLEQRGAVVVDATCPRVLKSQGLVADAAARGLHTVIVGDRDHGEVAGLAGHAAGCDVVRTAEEAEALDPLRDILVIAQTTVRREEFERVCSVLEDKCGAKGLVVEKQMTICPATKKRQSALKQLAAKADAVIVAGGKESANTRRLHVSAAETGLPAWHVETAAELPPEIYGFSRIGITAGASTPDWIIDEIEEKIVEGVKMKNLRDKKAFICDMDGVIYHGNMLLPGVKDFVNWLKKEQKKFLFLTNSSQKSPLELQQKLARLGVEVEKENFYTSALATASFLAQQKPGGSVFVIGEAGLINALYNAGFTMNDVNPDYVVVGESKTYNMDMLEHAVNLILNGAKLIGTNPDLTGPIEGGISPATGALMAPIELATGHKAYFIGKPNPLMMRHALKRLETKREDTVIVGDRMDTDVLSGLEAEIETVLVLSGVTSREDIEKYAYRPRYVLTGVGEIPTAAGNTEGKGGKA